MQPETMTLAEFLAFDDGTDTRYELIEGVMTAMAPPAARHGRIGGNIVGMLRNGISPPCWVHLEHGVPLDAHTYFQADIAVACGEIDEDGKAPDPVVIIEVVSPSSYNHDTGRKANRYRAIAACQAIVLVECERPHAIVWTRQEDGWLVQDHIGLDSSFTMPPQATEVGLADVYAGVQFAKPAA